MKKNLFIFTFLSGVLFVGTSVFAFQEPTGPPPTNNVAAPINVSTLNQYKEGYLSIGLNNVPSSAGLQVVGPTSAGNVGIRVSGADAAIDAGSAKIGVKALGEQGPGIDSRSGIGAGVYAEGGTNGVLGKTNLVGLQQGQQWAGVRGETSFARRTDGEIAGVFIYDVNDNSKNISYGAYGVGDIGVVGFTNDSQQSATGYLGYYDSQDLVNSGVYGSAQKRTAGSFAAGVRGDGEDFGGYFESDLIGAVGHAKRTDDGGSGSIGVAGLSEFIGVQGQNKSQSDLEGSLVVKDIDGSFKNPTGTSPTAANPFYYGVTAAALQGSGTGNLGSTAVWADYTESSGDYARAALGYKKRGGSGSSFVDTYYGGYFDVTPLSSQYTSGSATVSNNPVGVYSKVGSTDNAVGFKTEVGNPATNLGLSSNSYGVQARLNGQDRGLLGGFDAAVNGENTGSGVGVLGQGGLYGVYGTSATAAGVYGAGGAGIGVQGVSASGKGVSGSSDSDYGVQGTSSSATAIYGETLNWANNVFGVVGVAEDTNAGQLSSGSLGGANEAIWGSYTNPNATGVAVRANATGSNNGVRASGNVGVESYGTNIAVYGVSGGGSTGYGGYFGGGVGIAGIGLNTGVSASAAASGSVGLIASGDKYGVQASATGIGSAAYYGESGQSSADIYRALTSGDGASGFKVTSQGDTAYGLNSITTGESSFGVYGQATGADSYGLAGVSTSSDSYGVYGSATGSSSYGVFGTGPTGVRGETSSSSGIGVYGKAGSNAEYAGYFEVDNNPNSARQYGVYAKADGAGSYAGWFDGRLKVNNHIETGTIQVSNVASIGGDIVAQNNGWGASAASTATSVGSNWTEFDCPGGYFMTGFRAFENSGNLFFESQCNRL